jgi:hypothetical protein
MRPRQPACAPDPRAWYSDNPDERAWAVIQCGWCPIREVCALAGQDEPYGVWGGIDHTPAVSTKDPRYRHTRGTGRPRKPAPKRPRQKDTTMPDRPTTRTAELTSRHGVTREDLTHWTTTKEEHHESTSSHEPVPWNPRTYPNAPALPLDEQDVP